MSKGKWILPLGFWKRLEVLTPCAVRLLAKNGNDLPLAEQAMSDEQVASGAGLTSSCVRLISMRTDWTGIELVVARRFLHACRCDPENGIHMARVRDYLSGNPKWKYLKHSPHFLTTFKPLMTIYGKTNTTTR